MLLKKRNMEDKYMRRLKRSELLELLLEQRKKNEELTKELEQVKAELAQRQMKMENCGSIAEASLALSKVFEEAQLAADIYLEKVKQRCSESEDRDPENVQEPYIEFIYLEDENGQEHKE